MPELPDLVIYLEALERSIGGEVLRQVRLRSPFLLRTVTPEVSATHGRRVVRLGRVGKRLVLELEGGLALALHLMITGRLHWRSPAAGIPARHGLAAFDFDAGCLLLTESSSQKRASLHVVEGPSAVAALDAGGVEPLEARPAELRKALLRENRTLKRALTDPRIVSGIGNAYSDEILHRARLSPFKLTQGLDHDALDMLCSAIPEVLLEWIARLRSEVGEGFPEKVTAFRPEMAVHGRFGQPCPVCGASVQRVVYAANEANYCPGCQTSGRLLADRSLSRLLKADWPRTLEDLESQVRGRGETGGSG